MKTWMQASVLAAAALFGLSQPALAQPRPQPDQRHDQRKDERREERKDERREERKDARADERRDEKQLAALRERMERAHEAEQQRRKEARKDVKRWRDGRVARAEEHRKETLSSWGKILSRADAKAELATHADRMARLNRLIDIAGDKGDTAMAARAKLLSQREVARHAAAMQDIMVRAGVQ